MIQVVFPVKQDQPEPCGNLAYAGNGSQQLVIPVESGVVAYKPAHTRLQRRDLVIVQLQLLAPLLGQQLGSDHRVRGLLAAILGCSSGFDQPLPFGVELLQLPNNLFGRLPQGNAITVALGIFGQQSGIEPIIFTMMLGGYLFGSRGFDHRAFPTVLGQRREQPVTVDAGILDADYRVGRITMATVQPSVKPPESFRSVGPLTI